MVAFIASPLPRSFHRIRQHREYVRGDDLAQVDWKVYARSDRYYLKQYRRRDEPHRLPVARHSESMHYRGAGKAMSKLEYAQLVVFSLAYLVIHSRISAALATFAADIHGWLPQVAALSYLDDMIRLMDSAPSGERTDLARIIELASQRCSKPGVVVLVSDLLDDQTKMLTALKAFALSTA